MKNIIYGVSLSLLCVLFAGCYEDKGNYDYVSIGNVSVDVTSGIYTYNAQLGQHLPPIAMTVTTNDVDQSQLKYVWELKNNAVFIEIDDQRNKDFDRAFGPDDYFNTYTTYIARLKISWEERGVEFSAYSPLINFVLSGETGLMLLHGNETENDIGLIVDEQFMIVAETYAVPKIAYDSYSSANGGQKIPGHGIQIQQRHNQWSNATNSSVYVITDQTAFFAFSTSLIRQGEYDDLFYSRPGYIYHHGKPSKVMFNGSSNSSVIDDGMLFANGSSNPRFAAPVELAALPDYRLSKYSDYSGVNAHFCFDENSRRFVTIGVTSSATTATLYDSPENGPFNLNNMKADLLYLGNGGLVDAGSNYLAVMKSDAETFIAELRTSGSDQPGDTYARHKYLTATLPEFANARFHAFGLTNTMCYYTTANDIYQYAVAGSSGIGNGMKLQLDGAPIAISGEITMMKILRPIETGASTYQYHKRMMIVGTYESGVGTLHAILLDEGSGHALSHKTFTGFGRIYDANLKSF